MLRIVEILSFETVLAINAVAQRALSFQQGYLPLLAVRGDDNVGLLFLITFLLQFLTSGLLLKSTIQKNIKWVSKNSSQGKAC